MEIKFVTQASDPGLVKQYFALRHKLKDTFPNTAIHGDEKATYLLAVEEGKVRAGMRLNTPDLENKGWLPVDKVDGAKLENLFPNHPETAAKMRAGEQGHKVMYIDGIYSNFGKLELLAAMRAQKEMLQAIAHTAKEDCAMVFCFPKNHDARAITKVISREGVKAINLGPQPYINHEGETRGLHKNLLVFAIDPQLIGALRKPEPGIGESRARA